MQLPIYCRKLLQCLHPCSIQYCRLLPFPRLIVLQFSVAHESRTPYYGLGFFELLLDLGRAGFTSLTRVKARVDTIVFESMKITI
jgi:hypothetical protein